MIFRISIASSSLPSSALLSRASTGIAVLLMAVCWTTLGGAQTAVKQSPFPGVTVEIVELKRIEDKAVGLRYKVTNENDKGLGFGWLGAGEHTASGVALVDFKNGKRYGVGTAGRKCLCSGGGSHQLDLTAKATRQYWAQFGAPPAGVEKITVIIGNVPPFYNVPITK